jgi:hypothetical protein
LGINSAFVRENPKKISMNLANEAQNLSKHFSVRTSQEILRVHKNEQPVNAT